MLTMSERLGIGAAMVTGLVMLAFAFAGMAGLDAKLARADRVLTAPKPPLDTLQVKDCPKPGSSTSGDLDSHL
jgi:hypothetical protein